MTIKQHGGIFGRNPTFNEIGGTLTTAAQPNITSLGTQTENLAFADGNGIDFSATSGTGTSELFDDYEEGEYTPEITFGNAAVAQTYSVQTGRYTKAGRVVSVQASLIFTDKGTSTGTARVTLPFTVADALTPASFQFVGVSHTGFMQGFAATGGTTVQLQTNSDAGSTGNIADSNFTDTSRVYMSMTYIA